MDRKVQILGVAIALLLISGIFAAPKVIERVAKGKKLTDAEAPDGGFIAISPSTLAAQAGLPEHVYALARVLASESSSGPDAERAAIAWIVINQSKYKKKTVLEVITGGSTGPGYFGAQNAGGRYVSSRKDPRASDADLARKCLTGEISDPTGGARRFFHPQAQDAAAKQAKKGYVKTAADVLASWSKEGWEVVTVPGTDPKRFLALRMRASDARVS